MLNIVCARTCCCLYPRCSVFPLNKTWLKTCFKQQHKYLAWSNTSRNRNQAERKILCWGWWDGEIIKISVFMGLWFCWWGKVMRCDSVQCVHRVWLSGTVCPWGVTVRYIVHGVWLSGTVFIRCHMWLSGTMCLWGVTVRYTVKEVSVRHSEWKGCDWPVQSWRTVRYSVLMGCDCRVQCDCQIQC